MPREGGAGGRIAAIEIMLNSPLIQDLIFKGEVAKIKEVMSRSTRLGMKTFDQCLFELYETGYISYDDAIRNADSKNELRLRVKLESKRDSRPADDASSLSLMDEDEGRAHLSAAEPMSDTGEFKVTTTPGGLKTRPLFKLMVERKASDLFFTSNAPIKIKIEGQIHSINKQVLSPDAVRAAAFGLMTPEQLEYFQRELEIDFAISEPGLGRFRVAIFYQRGYPAMVMRYITADMPRMDNLGPAGPADRPGQAQARPDPDGRRHRLGQVHDAGGDDQLPQREFLGPHRHHRGSDRVPAHQQALDRQPARGRTRHQDATRARCAG